VCLSNWVVHCMEGLAWATAPAVGLLAELVFGGAACFVHVCETNLLGGHPAAALRIGAQAFFSWFFSCACGQCRASSSKARPCNATHVLTTPLQLLLPFSSILVLHLHDACMLCRVVPSHIVPCRTLPVEQGGRRLHRSTLTRVVAKLTAGAPWLSPAEAGTGSGHRGSLWLLAS
jgi:hypothetical protein